METKNKQLFRIDTRMIAANAIIAALYFALTMASLPIAYEGIQFRISELLVLLCFWRPDLIIGVSLGCFLANIPSTLGPWDMLIGTSLTLVSSIFVALSPKLTIALIWPIVFNAFGVGAELMWLLDLPFWPSVGSVAIGETTVIVISYIILMILWRNEGFIRRLNPKNSKKIKPSW